MPGKSPGKAFPAEGSAVASCPGALDPFWPCLAHRALWSSPALLMHDFGSKSSGVSSLWGSLNQPQLRGSQPLSPLWDPRLFPRLPARSWT